MSSLAQEESRSISENVTWGKRKSMEDGKVHIPYKNFLGYEKGEDGLPQIVEEEAAIVRQIYNSFLQGQTYRCIAETLTARHILTPRGKTEWRVSTVMSILRNEKYKGAALLQKTYTIDFLNKTKKKNEGELPQYYVENSHPAIIQPETFDFVQSEIKKRQPDRRRLNGSSVFAAKIICEECGGYYGLKVWHSNSQYKYKGWRCNKKYDGDSRCNTPHIREEELQAAFIQAFNIILGDKDRVIAEFVKLLPILADTTALEQKLADAHELLNTTSKQLNDFIEANTRRLQDQDEYNRRYNELAEECSKRNEHIRQINDEILEQKARKEKIRLFLTAIKHTEQLLTDFDENLLRATIESIIVNQNRVLTFTFRDGTRIPVTMHAKPEN